MRIPGYSKRQQNADWLEVRLPDSRSLVRFCDLVNVRADFILFGEGAPYRNEDRSPQDIEDDLAAAIGRKLAARGYNLAAEGLRLDGGALVTSAFNAAHEQLDVARDERRFSEMVSEAIKNPTAAPEGALPWEALGDTTGELAGRTQS